MKKVLLCAAALAVGGMSYAQVLQREAVHTLSPLNEAVRIGVLEGVELDDTTPTTTDEGTTYGADAPGDVFFDEDFGGSQALPTGWSTTVFAGPGGFPGFVWNNVGPTGEFTQTTEVINSATANNGFMLLGCDEANNPGGDTDIHAILQSPGIDVSLVDGMWINFEHKFRSCCSGDFAISLEVYLDPTLNTQLAEFDIRNENPVNSVSDDPKIESKHYVNTTGISVIYLVWRWDVSSHYFWMIDDIELQEAADFETTFDFWWYNGKDDITSFTNFYTFLPAKQMSAFDLTLGGVVANKGNLAQTNIQVEALVQAPDNSTYPGGGNPLASLASESSDSLDANAVNGFPEVTGTYTANWLVTSDQTMQEFDQSDNTFQTNWDATSITYSRAVEEAGIQFIQARTTNEILGVTFDFPAADEITAVDIYFGANVPNGLITEGATINVYLYNLTVDDFNSPISVADFYDIQAADVGTFARFPVSPAVSVSAGETWVAAIEVITETANGPWIGIDSDKDPAVAQVYECVGCQFGTPGSGPTDGWYSRNFRGSIPEIVMVTSPATSLCAGVNIIENPASPAEITYDLANFTADISAISPVGGAFPYTFLWNGPDPNVDGTTQNSASDIAVVGLYTVDITDANGCTGSLSFNVDNNGGNISVDEIAANQFEFSVYPNPNNGEFFLNVENGVSGNYEVTVTDLLGKQVHASNFLVSNGKAREVISLQNLTTGIYSVKVKNSVVEHVSRVVIE